MSDVDDWVGKYLEFVDRGVAMIPYARAKIWREFFLNPVSVIQKDNVGLGQRFKDLYVMTAIDYVLVGLMYIPMLLIMSIFSGGIGLMTVGILLAVIAVMLILSPVFMFIYSLLELLVAKALGGAGDMQANFNASALPMLSLFVVQLPLTILMVPFVWLGMVPVIGLCASCIQIPLSICAVVLSLYSYYLKYVGFKEVHKLSPIRAAGVVILPVILMVVVFVLLFVLMYAAMFAFMMSMFAAQSSAPLLVPAN
jgi:hypothetical protein